MKLKEYHERAIQDHKTEKAMNHADTESQRKQLNDLSGKIIGLCIEIHRELGPGLLESAYEECLAYELSQASLIFERQRPLPVRYKEVQLDCGYRFDFVVEGALILELKAVTELHPIHEAQLLTYLKLDKKSLGLLINFNVPALKQGVKRVACGDLFRPENAGRSDTLRLLKLLCASVPLWFR
jgi:GxxExxY protein